jgi:hypothetical protein
VKTLSLPELAHTLEDKAGDLRAARGQEQLKSQLARAASEFTTIATDLAVIASFISECIECGIADAFPKAPAGLLQRLDELEELSRVDPQGFVNADDLLAIRSQLLSVKSSWEAQASAVWAEYCRTQIPARDEAILSFLAETGDNDDAVTDIDRLDSILRQLAAAPPMNSRGGPRMLADTITKRRAIWSSIDVGQVPPAAMNFINSAGQGGAPLAVYSPDVAAWLTERGLVGNYVIVSRSGRE